jgi:menaquinone-dependent protoporphyrinogen oxidase
MTKILVAYATKHDSTAEIAHAIGRVLREAGHQVDVRSVEVVENLKPYTAVVLGSAVYVGKWQPSAAEFLTRYEAELAEREVWLFSSGPTGEGAPETVLKGWDFPEALKPVVDRIQPRDVIVFHGKLDPQKLSFMERLIIKGVKAPMGDFRNWDLIREWASAVARTLEHRMPT